jgi:hypothetical protein
MPTVAMTTVRHGGSSDVDRNMPITAQKIASCVTRGLVSAQYWRASAAYRDRKRVSVVVW